MGLKIPSQLKIGGHLYKVKILDAEDINNNCGEQNCARNTIKIRKDLPQDQIEETFLHEILHAINNRISEQEITFLAHTLYQVFRDNKLWD